MNNWQEDSCIGMPTEKVRSLSQTSALGLLRAFMLKTRRGYPARVQAQDKASAESWLRKVLSSSESPINESLSRHR